MKTRILQSILLIITIGALADDSATHLTNFAIGLAPAYSMTESEQIERATKKFVLDAPKGSRIRFDDAFNLKTIASFSVPEIRYDSPANRVRMLSHQFVTLTQWFKEARTNAVSFGLTNNAVLRVPEYLDLLAGDGGGHPRGILLIGSPLAEYPTEPSFSMTGLSDGPRVPSDGHLLAGLQSSPYGTAERKGRLRGFQISWCYGSENVWSNQLHKTLISRFWILFAKQQDATMVVFTPDLASVFATLPRAGRGAVAKFDLNPEDTKLEMRVARPRQVPTWLPESGLETNKPVALSAPQPAAVSSPVPQRSEARGGESVTRPQRQALDLSLPLRTTLDIGIMWESTDPQLDIDEYVVPHPGAAELWFQKVRTPEGTLIHDWIQPNNRTDFEWVKLNPGARLDQIEVWLNLFKGRGPISGRVAVHFEDKVYTGSFHIPATSGNAGRDSRTRATSQNWTRLDIQKIVSQTP